VLPLFALTLFVSASLLFLVQPMVGKMILPRLGGTPAVWNTCMVFFQGVLLIGYAYTHTLSTWYDRRRQVIVQMAVLALPFLVLPFALGDWAPPAEANPVLSVLWLLLGLVGLPFFVVSTSAPLLQRWFSSTDHPAAKDPYFLYGASNMGSMLTLLLYPLAVEPAFSVESQAWLWTIGYAAFIVLVAACAYVVWNPVRKILTPMPEAPAATQPTAPPNEAVSVKPRPRKEPVFAQAKDAAPMPTAASADMSGAPITLSRRLRWIGLAAVPSSMMLGMTTYLTTDIAAIPFFWVLPLALYLLTFILVFARWPLVWTESPHDAVIYLQPCFLMALVMLLLGVLNVSILASFAIHSAAFFFTALLCHGELARDRPHASHLTEFYLWLSVGGVLGGLFNALFAPLVFRMGNLEYPVAMILACLLRPSLVGKDTLIPGDSVAYAPTRLGRALDFLVPLGIGIVTFAVLKIEMTAAQRNIFLAGCIVATLALLCRPLRFGLGLTAMFLVVGIHERNESPFIFQDRGFFGFIKVRKDQSFVTETGEVHETYHTLVHGGINHGMQNMDPARRRDAITYFHPTSGVGQIFTQFKWPDARLPASLVALGPCPLSNLVNLKSEPPFAVVGLGIGTLATHARPLQPVDIYEIDPLIRRLSVPERDDEEPLFYYVDDALRRNAQLQILMGDGRLVMEKEAPEAYYHIIVLDAFSSDAIPVHLLTAEAIDLYRKKLAPGGVLVFNATNRYVDIRPVLADLAASRDMVCYYRGNGSDGTPTMYASDWVVLQKREIGVGPASKRPIPYNGSLPLKDRLPIDGENAWQILEPPGFPLWTDAYSNLLRVIAW